MEKKYMNFLKSTKYLGLIWALLFSFTLCAQDSMHPQSILAKREQIAKQSTLLNNSPVHIPIKQLSHESFASVNLGFAYQAAFDSLLNKYTHVAGLSSAAYADSTHLNDLEDDLKFYTQIIIPVSETEIQSEKNRNFIESLSRSKKVILAVFGEGKNLRYFDYAHYPILWTATADAHAAEILPQIIFGGIPAQGRLHQNYSAKYQSGSGSHTHAVRLKYTLPEEVDVSSADLAEIDKIVAEGIEGKAAPGMVVLVAKDGKVIFNKAYGHHTYDQLRPNRVDDIFDLASVTKVTATTPTVMRLVEENKLNLDHHVGQYIAKARNTPMNNSTVRDVMMHQAGFIPFIPFHNYVKEGDYSRDSSAAYPTKVADNYYIKKGFFEQFMWPKMLNSPLKTPGKYVYSDISMYVMQDIVEHVSQTPIDQYLQWNFYQPLGMQSAGFLPRNRFPKHRIVPTEDDQLFRKTLLEGYVHDQGAALRGGVAGHAGLFGSANDLAIFYQLMLNKGHYGGEHYFKESTIEKFIKQQSPTSRRGLGFDRWDPDTTKKYPSELASPETFGHTGYTGIAVWVDPSRQLTYVFLSNRVHPSVSEQLGRLNIRPRIQDVIIKAVDKAKK